MMEKKKLVMSHCFSALVQLWLIDCSEIYISHAYKGVIVKIFGGFCEVLSLAYMRVTALLEHPAPRRSF